MTITLPMPPSVNAMYRRRAGYGMYKTDAAKAWIEECTLILKKKERYVGKVEVAMYFYFEREADLDNRIKGLLDILQSAEIIDNDKQVYSILAWKSFDKKNPRVEVTVRSL